MTQSTLLELAKDGDPQAIAALMNLTLEPKGVIAKAVLEGDELHVFLSADRALNAKTSLVFVQRGILQLDMSAVRQVSVYGQQLQHDQPDWVETFAVNRSQAAEALEALSRPSSRQSSRFTAHPAMVTSVPLPSDSTASYSKRHSRRWLPRWVERTPLRSSLSNAFVAARQRLTQPTDQLRSTDQIEPIQIEPLDQPDQAQSVQGTSPSSPDKPRPAYLKLSMLVTLVAFVTGGAVALLAHSYTASKAERQAAGKPPTIASSLTVKSDAERTHEQQQTAARLYLETMNKAQQAFYRQNNRFAGTLEELERFAAVPFASRSDYSYKLTVPNSNQAQLTANPKGGGLKSYTAIVSIAKPNNQAVATICASQKAAQVPPLVFQSPEGKVQCPVESTKTS